MAGSLHMPLSFFNFLARFKVTPYLRDQTTYGDDWDWLEWHDGKVLAHSPAKK